MRSFRRLAFAVVVAALAGCNSSTTTAPVASTPSSPPGVPIATAFTGGWVTPLRLPGTPSNIPQLIVSSTTFTNGGALPSSSAQLGCGGTNVSPQISWSAGPAGTQSYMLLMFDPIAPTGTGFWHWTVYNIPATTTSLSLGFGTTPPAGGIVEGYTDNGSSGYGGPCPPVGDGVHEYFFVVDALSTATVPGATAATTGAAANFTVRGTILAQGVIVGTFSR